MPHSAVQTSAFMVILVAIQTSAVPQDGITIHTTGRVQVILGSHVSTLEQCIGGDGFCVYNGGHCNGSITTFYTSLKDHCICSIPEKQVSTLEQCIGEDGFCVFNGGHCNGSITTFYTSLKDHCICCIPEKQVLAASGEELWSAADTGNLSYVNAVIASGRTDLLNWRNQGYYNTTALHMASYVHHLDIVSALLAAGAHTDLQADSGATPIHYAVLSNNPAVINALIDAGADVDSRDNRGLTALMEAAAHDYVSAVEALITAQADVSLVDDSGSSALHQAALCSPPALGNRPDTVKLLLLAGASPTQRDNRGLTPGDVARALGHDEVVRVIDQFTTTTNTGG